MKKLILLLTVLFAFIGVQAQDANLRQSVEKGIQISIHQTENHQWREAFATCRALDAAIGNGNPELHYLVSKERFRMYSRINKPGDCRTQMGWMENWARQSKKASVIEDMLMAKAAWANGTGNSGLAMQCYKEIFNRRSAGKDDAGIDKCFKDMVAQAKSSNNSQMAGLLDKMYTQWQDSIAGVKASSDLKTLQVKYAEAQETISSQSTKIGFQWGFIIILIIIAIALGCGLGFFVILKIKNMIQIKKLKTSLNLANANNEQKSLFINNIGEQISPSLEAIANGDTSQVVNLQKFLDDVKEYMMLENTREEHYEVEDLNMERVAHGIADEVKEYIASAMPEKSDIPVKIDAHGITFASNEESLHALVVKIAKEILRYDGVERINLEFKKRNPHTGHFVVTGIGMKVPEDKRENIFQAFADVQDLSVDDGLALPTCSLMAYKLNGVLRLDENFSLNQGTRFIVELHS